MDNKYMHDIFHGISYENFSLGSEGGRPKLERGFLTKNKHYSEKLLDSGWSIVDEREWSSPQKATTKSPFGRRGGHFPPQQGKDPPLLRQGALRHVVCQHCFGLMFVPVNLPSLRKRKQKLRCGACMRISTFSVPRHSTDQELHRTQTDLLDYRSFSHQENQQQVDELNSRGSKSDSSLGEISEGVGEDYSCLSEWNSSWSSPSRLKSPAWSSSTLTSPSSIERRFLTESKHYSEKLLDSGWSIVDEGEWSGPQEATTESPFGRRGGQLPPKQGKDPPLLRQGALRHVVCQHCFGLMSVPVNLPSPRKRKQKLRCGACMRISTFSVPRHLTDQESHGVWSKLSHRDVRLKEGLSDDAKYCSGQNVNPTRGLPDASLFQHKLLSRVNLVPSGSNWSATSGADSGAGTQSQSPPHIISLEKKIPEQTHSRRTEAEGTCIKRTKEESSHGEGEPNDTSRGHLGNQTASEEIEHMTSSIKQKEITRDGIGQIDSGEPLLSDLNWSTATAPDSGDVPQSPRYMTSLEGEETIPEQPPSSIRGTVVGSTRIQQTNGNGSQCEEQGDTTEAVRDGKSRTQSTNLTASGEIKDMTPPTKREDLTMDPLGKSDEVPNAQAESMPANLMDWNSTQCTQREMIVGSNKSLRPDVLALGFKSFQDEFNPERILCIFSVSQGVVEILFSHTEGMAMLFGVGLSFSSVLLRKDGVKDGIVEVKELQQLVWMNHWSISEMSNFSSLLVSSNTSSIQPSGFDPVLSFSPKQAAERFGVGLADSPSYFMMMPQGEFQHEVSNVTAVSPSWIASLYDFLSCKGHTGNDAQAKAIGSEHNHGSSLTTTDWSLPSSSGSAPGTSFHESNQRSQGQESPEVTAIERGMENQPRQLAVKIRLDPENCIFRDKESEIPRNPFNPTDVDPSLHKFVMVPEVTIRFLYNPRLRGSGSKKMTTTLDVNFLIKGKVSRDPEEFGWYHDQLQLSFKCKQRGEVTRVSRENEIVSDHEPRTADSGYSRANSTIALEGKGREQKLAVGYRPIGGMQVIGSSKQENTVGSGEDYELSVKILAVCLKKTNFSIQKFEGLLELGYLATFFPSLHLLNVWDKADRARLQSSGIMSAVPVKIEGDWEVMRDDDDIQGSSESAKVKGIRFCKYRFSCKRELNLLRLQISERGRVHLSNFPNAKPELSVETVKKSRHLQQKLVCGFIINHSFSHMTRLEQPDPYVWNMVDGPCPRPADELVAAELQE